MRRQSTYTPMLAILCAVAVACMRPPVYRVEAISAPAPLPETSLLDVGVMTFDPGLPEDPADVQDRVFPQVRKAESNFIPYQLRSTLEDTEQWGAVRVIPSVSYSVDVIVEGKILDSNGEELALQIRATDASGRVWLDKRYRTSTDDETYYDAEDDGRDPYQSVYNMIANDLVAARNEQAPQDLDRIRTIAELRFAADLAPDAFGGYLEENEDGELELVRLPARNDPMLPRLRQLREREGMFVDLLNEHYARFNSEMASHYLEWRRISREESVAFRELRNEARMKMVGGALLIVAAIAAGMSSDSMGQDVLATGAAVAGAEMLRRGLDQRSQSEIHLAALEELDNSFNSEVKPMVVQIEGETIRLTGTARTQYEEWRHLLRELHAADAQLSDEIEFHIDPQDGLPPPTSPAPGS